MTPPTSKPVPKPITSPTPTYTAPPPEENNKPETFSGREKAADALEQKYKAVFERKDFGKY
jgi:hypothetical protein